LEDWKKFHYPVTTPHSKQKQIGVVKEIEKTSQGIDFS
jgi:hypothetical protein